ncbi:MAG: TlpA disulfide reductase family protein [Bacteroidota bacterium]
MRKIQKIFYILPALFFSLAANSQLSFGDHAQEITLPSVNGDTLRLSSLKGKVVLLDFWASWCGPCRYSNKKLVKLYPKYKEKGFEIFGVSLDDNSKNWKKAVEKDKVSWLQVIDHGGWDAQTAMKWHIDAIPTSYLIDRDGKLIAMNLEAKELEQKLKEIFGE